MASRLVLSFFLIFFGLQFSFAQHIDIDKKILSFLASEEKVNIIFSYEGLKFNEDSITEPAYLKEVTTKVKNRDNGEAAEEWLSNYTKSKQKLWPELFTNTLNEKISEYKKHPVFEINNVENKYTLRVNTDWMYFGYNVVIGKWPSKINLELTFYETSNPQNIIFTTTIRRAMGKNNETYKLDRWAKFRRVGKAYVKAGYKLGQAFQRVLD